MLVRSKIMKKKLENGEVVWETENGLQFKVDIKGDIGEYIGTS